VSDDDSVSTRSSGGKPCSKKVFGAIRSPSPTPHSYVTYSVTTTSSCDPWPKQTEPRTAKAPPRASKQSTAGSISMAAPSTSSTSVSDSMTSRTSTTGPARRHPTHTTENRPASRSMPNNSKRSSIDSKIQAPCSSSPRPRPAPNENPATENPRRCRHLQRRRQRNHALAQHRHQCTLRICTAKTRRTAEEGRRPLHAPKLPGTRRGSRRGNYICNANANVNAP